MLAFWATLAMAGLAPVLYLAGLVAWQIMALFQRGFWVPLPLTLMLTENAFPFLPALGWAWLMSPDSLLPVHTALMSVLSRVHAGAIFGLVGLGMIALGLIGVRRHHAAIRAERQRAEDRLRRVRDYRDGDGRAASLEGRREPFISEPRNPRAAAGGAR